MRFVAIRSCQDTTAFSHEQRIYFIDHIEIILGLFGFISQGVTSVTNYYHTYYRNRHTTTRKQKVQTVKVKIVGFMMISCYK